MDNNTTYLMTKELDAHSMQIGYLQSQIKHQNNMIGGLIAGLVISGIGLVATVVELMLFEERTEETLKKKEEVGF